MPLLYSPCTDKASNGNRNNYYLDMDYGATNKNSAADTISYGYGFHNSQKKLTKFDKKKKNKTRVTQIK